MWNFEAFSSRDAVIAEDGRVITYAALAQKGEGIAGAIGRRCLVFCLCTNSPGSVIGYTACLNHGIVPLLLASQLDAALLQNLIDTYLPAYLWMPEDMAGRFERFGQVYADEGYVLLRTSFEKEYPLAKELALLLTTSGSTGSPKLVRQSYQNVRSNAQAIAEYLELDETERPITTLPMNYTYGLSIINSHLFVGATILLTEKALMQKEFWAFLKEQKATSFGGVPYTYEMLDRLRFLSMELPHLRTMTQAGGKLAPELHKKFAEYARREGKRFVVMYGQTEATARMAYLPYGKSLEKYGSMGIAIPGGKFSLINEGGRELTDEELGSGMVGELVYEGENVTLGYAECGDDLIHGDERHGRLATGDMAKRDADGYYYIVGRKKRFLKIFGNRVNLDEIERMVKREFPSTDCASAGNDDCMYVFVTDSFEVDAVWRYISEKTGLNHIAIHVQAIEAIPKNDAGKTLYRELEKYYKE